MFMCHSHCCLGPAAPRGSFSPCSEFGSGLVGVEDVRAGGDGGHGPDSSVEFPPAAERRDRRRAQQETRQQGEVIRHVYLSLLVLS